MSIKTKAADIFARAFELKDEPRETFLRSVCGEDAELRLEVERLLVDAGKADSFFADNEGTTIIAENFDASYSEQEGDQVGTYILRQQIGEGGFGVVWMAEQIEPIQRMVALKVVKAGMDTKQILARFEAERQALAMMDHPNIAKVLDAGATPTGRPYFAMELVKGITITEFCSEQKLDTRERLALFQDVCSAINHAHQKGIIHRDLKPSNVMVTLEADRPVVKVIDFGIAKATQNKLTEKTLFTRFEQFLGTPAYMSPEQAAMSNLDIDTRSDIYSLGVLLYELLTGAPPFDSKSLLSAGYDEMRRIIKEDEPPKPSTRLTQTQATEGKPGTKAPRISASSLKDDLDWIVMKAIEKDRTRRYETANAFAQDIRQFLSDLPVSAAAPTPAYRLGKFARRNRAALSVAAIIAILLIVGVTVSTFQAVRATKAERLAWKKAEAEEAARIEGQKHRLAAEASAEMAQRSFESLRRTAYSADMNLTMKAIDEGNLGRAQMLLNRHKPQPDQIDIRGFEWRYLWAQSRSQENASLGKYGGSFGGIAISPDANLVAYVDHGNVVVCAMPNREVIATLRGVPGPLIMFSPDGRQFLAEGSDAVIHRWDVTTWEEHHPLEGLRFPFTFAENGKTLVARADGRLSVWSAETWTPIKYLPGEVRVNQFSRHALATSADGGTLFLGQDGGIRSWDLATGRELDPIEVGNRELINSIAVSPNDVLAAAHFTGEVTLWDVQTKMLLGSFTDHRAWVSAVGFSSDGSVFASASADRTVRLYDLKDGRSASFRNRLLGHDSEIWAMAISPDARWLVTGSEYDGTVRLWDVSDPVAGGQTGHIRIPLEFTNSGQGLVGWSDQNSFVHLDIVAGTETQLVGMPVPRGLDMDELLNVREAAWEPLRHRIAGRRFAAQVTPAGVEIWNLQTGKREQIIDEPGIDRNCVSFSADGSLLATWGFQDGLQIWSTADWSTRQLAPAIESKPKTTCFSPNNKMLAVIYQGEGMVIDLTSNEFAMMFETQNQDVMSVAFSHDGKYFAYGTGTNLIYLRSIQKRDELAILKGHVAGVHELSFSPDDRTLVSCGDTRVKLWNVETGQELFTLYEGAAEMLWPQFSPDGTFLVSGAFEHLAVQSWHAPSWEEIVAAEKAQKNDQPIESILVPAEPR